MVFSKAEMLTVLSGMIAQQKIPTNMLLGSFAGQRREKSKTQLFQAHPKNLSAIVGNVARPGAARSIPSLQSGSSFVSKWDALCSAKGIVISTSLSLCGANHAAAAVAVAIPRYLEIALHLHSSEKRICPADSVVGLKGGLT